MPLSADTIKAATNTSSYKLANSSVTLSETDNDPQTTAALVLYYAGAKNNQKISVDLVDIGNTKSLGIHGKIPAGAEVLYKVSLGKAGSAYYTIANDKFYIANKDKQFNHKAVTFATMVNLANQNNTGTTIKALASQADIQDQRSNADTNDNTQRANANNQPSSNSDNQQSDNLSPQDKARAAMNADPNIDPDFKRRITLPPDDPDYIPATHDPESWR